MNYGLTEQHKMILDTARDLATLDLTIRAEETDTTGLFPWDSLRQVAEAEFMGMLLPPEYGGGGADLLSFVLAAQELAKGCANTTLILVTHMAASQGILLGGGQALKQRVLPSLAKGDKLAAFAATEANSGASVLAIETTAQAQEDHYLVNGSKIFVTGAEEAEYYVTVVRTGPGPGPDGLSALLIEKENPGFNTGKRFLRMGMNGTSSGEVYLNNCRVEKGNLLGREGGYMPLGLAIAGIGMLGLGAIALGLAEASLERCLGYGKLRTIAGRPLGCYQGVSLAVSEMAVAVEAMKALLYAAARAHQEAPPGLPLDVYKAKLFTTQTALAVIDKAIQIHGGTGYTKDLPLERYYRDARGLTLHFSPTEPLKETLGLALMGLMP